MSDGDKNGTELPAAETSTYVAVEEGSLEHILNIIATRLDHQNAMIERALGNDAIFGQAFAMLLSGAAHKVLLKKEVEAMIKRLDPNAKFSEVSPILHGLPGRH